MPRENKKVWEIDPAILDEEGQTQKMGEIYSACLAKAQTVTSINETKLKKEWPKKGCLLPMARNNVAG